ncbi:IucA/IucC family protein [Entomobacter blattae]|uniref:IucA / IucC family protein n=1 Tax=Entomobacter blattae TaxID=2762277 RepID=A0A7H1NTY1_9PROT|nr:IucA/IucC family protein [Entomobacter blattae]QNT79241.1 IucA / IucC family protein [Entomobacter blattae]
MNNYSALKADYAPISSAERYILLRIMDTVLREDLFGISSQGILDQEMLDTERSLLPHQQWLKAVLKDGSVLWLAVEPAKILQRYKAASATWYYQALGQERTQASGIENFLRCLASGQDGAIRRLFHLFQEEALLALNHTEICRAEYEAQKHKFQQVMSLSSWHERLLGMDWIASFSDHPFYPTARAKVGFDHKSLQAYAPEFSPHFKLRWIALPTELLIQPFLPPEDIWPTMKQLGLPQELEKTHQVIPVHPLTWPHILSELPVGAVAAPMAFCTVRPTLSVRTVACVENLRFHIKLPLYMRTLGNRNLRLIKPSTVHDGYSFQKILENIAASDPMLGSKIVHVDERRGGYVQERADLAYILREYPLGSEGELAVPVAALVTLMGDGRPLMLHLADHFYEGDILAWAKAHLDVFLGVHLRLWLQYGIALEANQQNAILLYQKENVRLLMKDNDSARLYEPLLLAAKPELAEIVNAIQDGRIKAKRPEELMEMLCTITLQLCIMAPFEELVALRVVKRKALYGLLREVFLNILNVLSNEGIETAPARFFMADATMPVKYLLTAGTLLPKDYTDAADINKYYGWTSPNIFMDENEPITVE